MFVRDVLEIFGPRKDFGGRWLGSSRLNRLGLHTMRLKCSNAMLELRRAQLRSRGGLNTTDELRDEGIQVLPEFLEPGLFARVRAEAHSRVEETELRVPLPVEAPSGFGAPTPFSGGFDRFDGDTLNRYVDLDEATAPWAWRAVRERRLADLCEQASGFRHRPERFSLYQTLHGANAADIQKTLHRDTFQSAIKLWLFLDEVSLDQGPFVYVPKSHRLTRERLGWEQQRAIRASESGEKGGSFRIAEAELADLGLPKPVSYPVVANTLIIADVRGFHRRGHAVLGARRLALYASLRFGPFVPIVY